MSGSRASLGQRRLGLDVPDGVEQRGQHPRRPALQRGLEPNDAKAAGKQEVLHAIW